MSSIFTALFKWRARKSRSPKEDYLTEAFAGVLERECGLDVAFVEWLIGIEMASVVIETQRVADSKDRFDLWMDAKGSDGARHLVVVENKVLAAEGVNQLPRYETYLATRIDARTRTLIYLTPHARSDFESSKPCVTFREIRWYQVYGWAKEWSKKHDHSILVVEFLRLMEDWGLALKLNANDLAVATAYQTSVRSMLLQILDEIWSVVRSRLSDTASGQWRYDRRYLSYHSAWIDAHEDLYISFAFDFDRDDEKWNVSELQLPSAYVAIRGSGTGRYDWDELPSQWSEPPVGWESSDYIRVKQLSFLKAEGDSLHTAYLDFFTSSLDQLWTVVDP